MKKLIIPLLLALLLSCTAPGPKIVGHRGCRFDGPYENTLASLSYAMEVGVDAVEFDVQLTADDQVLVFHGPRIPGQEADVRETSFDDARAVVLPGGHQMPTLEEWFGQAGRDLPLIMELKKQLSPEKEALLVDLSMEAVCQAGMQGRVSYTSFSESACDRVLAKDPSAKVIFLGSGVYVPTAAWAKEKGYRGISYDLNGFLNHPEIAEEAKRLGIETTLWLVNDLEVASWARKHKIDYISSDFPQIHTSKRK